MNNNKSNSSYDIYLFKRMVEILLKSGTGTNYGTEIKDRGVLASVMNEQGYTNRYGGKLNSNAIYQIIHRLRDNDQLDDLKPDWEEFSTNRSEHEKFSRLINSLDFSEVKHWFDEIKSTS